VATESEIFFRERKELVKGKMTEYFKQPGLSSGKLAQFWNGGSYSPDHALSKLKWRYDFEKGNAFEALCHDTATGNHTFFDKFFISDQKNQPPDEVALAVPKEKEALEKLVVLTKDGKKSQTYKKRHAYIEECLFNPGLMPVCQSDYATLKELAEKLCSMPFPQWHGLSEYLVGDYLGRCEWQSEHYWEKDNIGKKALADCLLCLDDVAILADIKYTSAFGNFRKLLRSKHWIQDIHYSEGIEETRKIRCEPMLFFVGCSGGENEPALAQIWRTDPRNRDELKAEYDQLCSAYSAWERGGKQKKGWIADKTERIWV